MLRKCLLIMAILYFRSVHAGDCFELAGRDYRIDPDLLRAIAWHESRYNPAAIGISPDRSIDVGLMQINSQHFDRLSKVGITKEHLLNYPCMNIYTGAYFLSKAISRWGYNWKSVGAYNAGFRDSQQQSLRRYNYAREIEKAYLQIKSAGRH